MVLATAILGVTIIIIVLSSVLSTSAVDGAAAAAATDAIVVNIMLRLFSVVFIFHKIIAARRCWCSY